MLYQKILFPLKEKLKQDTSKLQCFHFVRGGLQLQDKFTLDS